MHLYDYCIINDGGVSFIVTTAARERTLKHPPAYIGATYAASNLNHNSHVQDFWRDAYQDVGKRGLYKEADVTPSEIKCAEIYDNFTPTIVFALRRLWLLRTGQRPRMGAQAPASRLPNSCPVNTCGGHTSESYMRATR